MESNQQMPEFGNGDISRNAVSIYQQNDGLDDFPVLKAFQQYVDAEQAKARKRLLMMGVFFGALMLVIIAVFVIIILNANQRNQTLNDRLLEFVMKDRMESRRDSSAVVVQPPQDSAAILAFTAKLDEMQKKIEENQKKAENAAAEAAAKAEKAALEAAKQKEETPEAAEIKRLKKLLADEKERIEAEKKRKHQEEIEAYRRKNYPELYRDEAPLRRSVRMRDEIDDLLEEMDEADARREAVRRKRRIQKKLRAEVSDDDGASDPDEEKAITYFDEQADEKTPSAKQKKSSPPSISADKKHPAIPQQPTKPAEPEKKYSIPVDIRGSSGSWQIPVD